MKEDKIWSILSLPGTKGFISQIARHYKISRSTVQDWRSRLQKQPNWIPNHYRNPEKSRIFNSFQENCLAQMIKQICEQLQLPMTNSLFRTLATTYYYTKIPEEERNQPNLYFNCSDHFIKEFKKRAKFSRRRAHFKRRPEATEQEIEDFLSLQMKFFKLNNHQNILKYFGKDYVLIKSVQHGTKHLKEF